MFLDKNKSLSHYYESALQNLPEDLTEISFILQTTLPS